MGQYIKFEDVRVRLIGKVRFTDDEDDKNKMHVMLANRLINEAEGDVEHDLSPRYSAPFTTDAGTEFKNLPERPTKEYLRTLCELKATIRILETDFGAGSAVNGDKYTATLQKRYDAMVKKNMLRHEDNPSSSKQGWVYPPLPGLQLNYFNKAADDGYSGQVLSTSMGDGGYPRTQINDPSENYVNGIFDEVDG